MSPTRWISRSDPLSTEFVKPALWDVDAILFDFLGDTRAGGGKTRRDARLQRHGAYLCSAMVSFSAWNSEDRCRVKPPRGPWHWQRQPDPMARAVPPHAARPWVSDSGLRCAL